MAGSISVRIQPLGMMKAAGQGAHDLRMGGQVPGYVDQKRSEQNSIIMPPPPPAQTRDEIAGARKRAGQAALRHDARLHIAGIITFSHEAQATIEAMTPKEQDALFLKTARDMERQTGHRLIGLVVHRDEATPHAHFTLRGYRTAPDGSEHPARFTRTDLKHLQDAAAESVKHLGIERGKPAIERIKDGEDYRKTRHRTVNQLSKDAPQELKEILEKIETKQGTLAKTERLIQKAENTLSEKNGDIEKVQKRIETYEKRASAAQAALDEMMKKADKIRAIMPKPQFKKSIIGTPKITMTEQQYNDFERQAALFIDYQTRSDREFYQKKKEELQDQLNALQQQQQQLHTDQRTAQILEMQNRELKKQLEHATNQLNALHEQNNPRPQQQNDANIVHVAQTGFNRP